MTSITKCVQLCSAEQLAMLQLQNEGCVCREHVGDNAAFNMYRPWVETGQ